MMVAIRKSLRDFIAVVALVVIAAVTSYVILQEQRLRIPILEEKPFELKAEFETAQAVVPGQGQTLRVAGVRVGDVSQVELEDGRAIVTFDVDRKYLPIYKDATLLLRPRTGLKDMFFALDPGTRTAGEYEEGDVVPMTNTAPDVNLDEVLAGLDGDSRDYLRTLIVGAGQGLAGRDKDLGKMLAALGPVNRDLDKLSTEVAKHDENLARLIHNLSTLTRAVGQQDDDVARLIDASNTTLEAIGEQDPDVQQATALLPETLRNTRQALAAAKDFGDELGPAFNSLRPFARRLPEVNAATTDLARSTTPVIQNQIRPFVRAARPVVPDLREAADGLSAAAPNLTKVTGRLNELFNMAAFNPGGAEPPSVLPGDRTESYLYWAGWAAHNATSVFGSQDAHGPYWRVFLSMTCADALELVTSPFQSLPLPPALINQIIGGVTLVTGLVPLLGPGGPCA
jgi:phospholipid/cholesterol/gamma-HCH transport system substrate-binding protein